MSSAVQPLAISDELDPATPIPTMPAVTELVSEVLEPSQTQRCEVTAREFLNVRGGPSVSWDVLYQLESGERVMVSDWLNGWAMVGAAQWVNGGFLKC